MLTSCVNWIVRRRYSDFYWLRNILVKTFPGHVVPPLPSKKTGSRRFENDFVLKRMNLLQNFMAILCDSEYFKSSEALIAFLYQKDRTVFENKMKEYNSMQVSQYVEDFKTFSGKVNIVIDENNEKYFNNTSKYFSIQDTLLQKINNSMKNYYLNMTNAYINLEDAEKDFEALSRLNKRVLMVNLR